MDTLAGFPQTPVGAVLRRTRPNAIYIPNRTGFRQEIIELIFYSKVQKHLNTIGFDTSPPLARFCGVLTQMRSAFLTSPIP